jgi:hypothetical protein
LILFQFFGKEKNIQNITKIELTAFVLSKNESYEKIESTVFVLSKNESYEK